MRKYFWSACLIMCVLTGLSSLVVADNPFAQAKVGVYQGVFVSEEMEIRLKKAGDQFKGEVKLLEQNQSYQIQGRLQGADLVGQWGSGDSSWRFKFTTTGNDTYSFDALEVKRT